MTRSEHCNIIKRVNMLSNEELEKEYYDALFESLGSLADEMEEQNWDMIDVIDRRKYEKYLQEKSDILYSVCIDRGIKLLGVIK